MSMVAQRDVIEQTLMTKRPVNVFQIPPMASS